MRDVMTVDQVAAYLQIPKSTIYKLVQEGQMPARKVGRQWRFHRDAIDAWLAHEPKLAAARSAKPKRKSGSKR